MAKVTASCGTTAIDLDQVGPWDDKDSDKVRDRDEIIYKDRYFEDQEWSCYEKLVSKITTLTVPAYHVVLPETMDSQATAAIKNICAVYAPLFKDNSLHVGLNRSQKSEGYDFYPLKLQDTLSITGTLLNGQVVNHSIKGTRFESSGSWFYGDRNNEAVSFISQQFAKLFPQNAD